MHRKPKKGKSLAEVNPELAKQWHTSKNGDLTAYDVTPNGGKKVWWKCLKDIDHEWDAKISNRNNGSGCPLCPRPRRIPKPGRSFAEKNPDLINEWDSTKNGDLTPYDVTSNSGRKFWWKCPKAIDHEWEASLDNRSRGKGCPYCCGQRVARSNSLSTISPNIAKEWHPIKNGRLTAYDVTPNSGKKVWWKCPKETDHEWEASVDNRAKGKGCPCCSGRKAVKSNCLATTHPEIAKQWHPTKNGDLTPYDVTYGSDVNAWWKCDKGDDHEWSTVIGAKRGCSICNGKTVVKSNCLATTHPEIAKQWHPTKNGDLTPYDVTYGSDVNAWWKCDKGDDHEWSTAIGAKFGCPFCTLTSQSKQELTIMFELIQFFKDINPKGFKTRIKGKRQSIDIYIPKLKLGIEFDGNYWHKDNAAKDKLKTVQLEEEGFEIFRVREEPLKRIFDDDIMSKKPFNAKQVTNDILIQIMSRYTLDAKKIAKIESYIAKKELQNEKGLNKYIDMILTEKAEKKK